MRGTIHLVTRDDALLLPALTAPLYARDLVANALHGKALRSIDVPAVTAAARALVEAEPRVTTDLGRLLAERWPDVPPGSLAYAARGTLPLVQVPPRGVWGRSGATTWTTADAWFGTPSADLSDPRSSPARRNQFVLRYLRAFGPASVADAQNWSGLSGLRAVVDRLGDRIVRYRADPSPGAVRVRELLDVPDGLLPDPQTPGPRALPARLRQRRCSATPTGTGSSPTSTAARLQTSNGVVPATFLLDGRVAGTWAVTRERRRAGDAHRPPVRASVDRRPADDRGRGRGAGPVHGRRRAEPPRDRRGLSAQPTIASTYPARSASRSPVSPSRTARLPRTSV